MKSLIRLAALLLVVTSAFAPSVFAQEAKKAPETDPLAPPKIKDISAVESRKLLDKTADLQVLDLRTPAEFAAGHLKAAKNIDALDTDTFGPALAKLDKSKSYLIHCASGGRSGRAKAAFTKLGFKKVTHMKDGFNAWKKAGFPVDGVKKK